MSRWANAFLAGFLKVGTQIACHDKGLRDKMPFNCLAKLFDCWNHYLYGKVITRYGSLLTAEDQILSYWILSPLMLCQIGLSSPIGAVRLTTFRTAYPL